MTQTILWPRAHPDDHQIELSAIGEGFNPVFCSSFDEVTDAQWASADAVVGPAVPPQHIPKLTRCRIYVKPAVGFDDVDLAQFSAMGIPVCNTPDYGTREVADHAMALMLTLTKSIAFHDESLRADLKANWRPALNPFGRRMADCTLGVVGVGRIGTAAVLRAKAFDMDVVFYDPHQPSGYELALGVRRADSLEELMAQSDIVTVHAPLNEGTRKLIGRQARHDPGEHRARADRGHRRPARCAEGRHGAGRRPRCAAAGAAQRREPADRCMAAQRAVDPSPAGGHPAFGLLHAGELA